MDSKHLAASAEDFEDFFESALCGFVLTDGYGIITRINSCTAHWLNCEPQTYVGKRISDLFAVGGKIYLETHLWPLLLMQGHFDEVAVELLDSGSGKTPVYINGYVKRSAENKPLFARFTLFKATDRRVYEENLQMAKQFAETNLNLEKENAQSREQFIAVLGHDLRNPLGGIISASQLLARGELDVREKKMVNIIERGAKRMHEMINNIMDLARGRLGGGITLSPTIVNLEELLDELCNELLVAWPERNIERHYHISRQIECDSGRIGQLVSNLLANAITHGAADKPVILNAVANDNYWEISVTNQGKPIPQKALTRLFHPFHRESNHASSNGLGLGLYIASEIAKAHNGMLSVTSDEQYTQFTFRADIL